MCEKCLESLHSMVFDYTPEKRAEFVLPVLRTQDGVEYSWQSEQLFEATFSGVVATGLSEIAITTTRPIYVAQGVQRPMKAHVALLWPDLMLTAVGGALTNAAGFINYRDPIGALHTLGAWSSGSLTGAIAELTGLSQRIISNNFLTNNPPADLGRIVLDTRVLTLGGATSITINVQVNWALAYERA